MSADRRVHAESDHIEVVRYNRAGKWRIEAKPGADHRTEKVPFPLAVEVAHNIIVSGGRVHFGLPGGERFDARLKAAIGKS